MGFSQRFCFEVDVDIEELMYKWNEDPKIVNNLIEALSFSEYALINMIVTQGLNDILGQEPAEDDPIDDDPFERPGINNPNLDPDNPNDEDPFARPSGWNPSAGIFYDEETGNLVDKDGNIIKKADEKNDHPYWPMWVKYYNMKYPETKPEDIPAVVEDPNNPEFEDFMNWMWEQHGDEGIAGGISTPDML